MTLMFKDALTETSMHLTDVYLLSYVLCRIIPHTCMSACLMFPEISGVWGPCSANIWTFCIHFELTALNLI